MAFKILIIEDHEMFRDGLQFLISQLDDVLNETAEIYLAGNLAEANNLSKKHNDLGLVLLDLQIPGSQAFNTLEQVRENLPLAAIIVISALEMDYTVRQIMTQGADGFIAKSCSRSSILEGIKKVLQGELVIQVNDKQESNSLQLSPRLTQTIELLEEGYSNKEIGKKLGISDTTARDYVSELLRLLNAENRVQVVVRARKLGLLIN